MMLWWMWTPAVINGVWAADKDVKAAYQTSVPGGESRLENLKSKVEAAIRDESTKIQWTTVLRQV